MIQELDITTGQENQVLKDWNTYLVQLSCIDLTHTSDIDWPIIPKN
ncbi:tail fiber assembly protein [Dickeya fangzhongdai]|nr:tail fiber assembly protein [Dickeya fangzhongdai]